MSAIYYRSYYLSFNVATIAIDAQCNFLTFWFVLRFLYLYFQSNIGNLYQYLIVRFYHLSFVFDILLGLANNLQNTKGA